MITTKHILAIITAILIVTQPIQAQEPTEANPTLTPTPTPKKTSLPLDKTIKSLKEKIEDKVEEINESSRQAISGLISSIKDGTLVVNTDDDMSYTVTIDDTVTSFFATSSDETDSLDQADLKTGDYVVVSGPLIEQQMSANNVYRQPQYVVSHGHITAIDKSSFSIDVVTLEKDEYTLDIENDTAQSIMDSKTFDLSKAGFSKYQVGDNLHFVMIKPKGGKRATATRTLIIPQEHFVEDDTTTPSPKTTKTTE